MAIIVATVMNEYRALHFEKQLYIYQRHRMLKYIRNINKL